MEYSKENLSSAGQKMLEWWEKNFASYQLGDERLDNRAFSTLENPESRIWKSLVRNFQGSQRIKKGL